MDYKVPTIEESLKSISWHLKCLVDELKKANEIMKNLSQTQGTPF